MKPPTRYMATLENRQMDGAFLLIAVLVLAVSLSIHEINASRRNRR